jgi:hypothetical protein
VVKKERGKSSVVGRRSRITRGEIKGKKASCSCFFGLLVLAFWVSGVCPQPPRANDEGAIYAIFVDLRARVRLFFVFLSSRARPPPAAARRRPPAA